MLQSLKSRLLLTAFVALFALTLPSLSFADDYQEVCGDVIAKLKDYNERRAKGEPVILDAVYTQRMAYCDSYRAKQAAAGKSAAASKLWYLTAATCGYVCAFSAAAGPAGQKVCGGSAAASLVYDVVAGDGVKALTGAFSALGGMGGMGVAAMGMLGGGGGGGSKAPATTSSTPSDSSSSGGGASTPSSPTAQTSGADQNSGFKAPIVGGVPYESDISYVVSGDAASVDTGASAVPTAAAKKSDPLGMLKMEKQTACAAAMFSVMTIVAKQEASKDMQSQAKSDLDKAAELAQAADGATTNPTADTMATVSNVAAQSQMFSPYLIATASSAEERDCMSPTDAQATTRCAIGSDTRLKQLDQSGIQQAFKEMTGQDASKLMGAGALDIGGLGKIMAGGDAAKASSLQDAINTYASGVASGAIKGLKDTALAKADASLMGSSGSTYRGGGAPGKAAQTDGPDFGALLQGMMGGAGGPAKDAQQAALSAVDYSARSRGPASIPEDRTLSLFHRATAQYVKWGLKPPPQEAK